MKSKKLVENIHSDKGFTTVNWQSKDFRKDLQLETGRRAHSQIYICIHMYVCMCVRT